MWWQKVKPWWVGLVAVPPWSKAKRGLPPLLASTWFPKWEYIFIAQCASPCWPIFMNHFNPCSDIKRRYDLNGPANLTVKNAGLLEDMVFVNWGQYQILRWWWWTYLLCKYGGSVRHVGVKMVEAVEGLVLDACGEDYWGQRLRQLGPECSNLELQVSGKVSGFINSKAKLARAVLINTWHLLPGVEGNPGMLPSSGRARLAWNPKSFTSSAIACGRWGNIESIVFNIYSNIF